MKKLSFLLAIFASFAFAQGNTALMNGQVTDPAGAAVPGAQVSVTNVDTKAIVNTTTNERGEYALPSMPSGRYEISVSHPGFKSAKKAGIEMAAGVDATVNVKLEIGQATETVTVEAGAEIVQATTAELSTTITGRQINELPTATRNGMELFTMMPGASTTTSYRTTYINGMPLESINVTIDGLNTNDNWLKSQDGFFSYIMPSVDSLEEVTLSTSAGGVDSTAQGGAQLKFTTKSGTNEYHGGVFWQHRNTFFNSNYYFNTINHTARDLIKLNQGGFHVGGPIKKNKLLFFTNYEIYKLPSSSTFTRTVLPPTGQQGNFAYCPTTSTAAQCSANPSLLRTVNVFSLAQQANAGLPSTIRPYRTSIDPIVGSTLNQIWGLVQNGNLQNNQPSNDFNRYTYRYVPTSNASREFLTSRVDYNLTSMHHLSFVLNYDWYTSVPDILNSVVPVYEGTGTVLGSNINAGQRSRRFAGTATLRSALSARLTNELRVGANGGTVLFFDAVASGAFSPWKGFNPSLGYGLSGVTTSSAPSRRNAPVKDLTETLSWVKGAHQFSFGGSWQSVATWQQSIGTESIPGISFGLATNDPANTGSTAWLVQSNFPGISTTDLGNLGNMFATLTGRVSSISQQVVENEITHQYAHAPAIDRNHQREMGVFAQDTWRVRPNLTITIGARVEHQFAFENVNNTYSYVGLDGIWGLSGVGHLFQPGTLTGIAPTFKALNGHDAYNMPTAFLPSVGLAYQLPAAHGILGKIFTGSHNGAAVLRGGYSISSTRGGGYNFTSIWGSNKGLYYDTSVSPSNNPTIFGAPGGVYFTDPSFPAQPNPAAPQFPLTPSFTDSVNDFDPHLKLGYVQSWNVGYQRELSRNTVVEVRYTGNHGVSLWRQVNLNETNIYENGFLNEELVARQNLAIANGVSVDQLPFITTLKSTNYGSQGLAGQAALKILPAALGTTCCNDTTTANNLARLSLGSVATSISTNASRMAALTAAGYPINFFQVNPTVGSGGAWLMTNLGSSYYDAGQVEVRRRLSTGLQVQGSYVWAHSLINGAINNSASANQPTTLRNLRLDRTPPTYDIRHAIKANWIYEFPFGGGRHFLTHAPSPFIRKALEGWEMAGTTRIQAGQPARFTSGRACINANECGVVLHNITMQQIQDMMGVYKTTGTNGIGIIYNLPIDLIQNSEAAFNQGGFTLDPNKPYIGPQTAPGQLGYNYYMRGPWQKHFDVSLVKKTKIGERANVEARAQALNVLNVTNFYLGGMSPNSTTFGQITSAFRDTSNAVDPGGRILEFVLRVNF
jgi:Carboxypeptidase regulatory-like domain